MLWKPVLPIPAWTMREGTGNEEERRMSDLKFIYVTGEWESTGTPPENNKEKFYIVSLYHTEGHWSRIPDCYWRYWENRWEFYGGREVARHIQSSVPGCGVYANHGSGAIRGSRRTGMPASRRLTGRQEQCSGLQLFVTDAAAVFPCTTSYPNT